MWLGHLHRGSFLAINVSNVGRALPSLAVISIGLGLLGVGFTNVTVALVILAAPVMLTNAYVAVDRVDQDAVRGGARHGHDAAPGALARRAAARAAADLRRASGPRPSTSSPPRPLAALAGGGGLGDIIVNQPTYGPEGVVAGSLAIAALAFATEGVFALLQYPVTPRAAPPARKKSLLEPTVGTAAA